MTATQVRRSRKAKKKNAGSWLKNNALSLVAIALFLIFWIAQSVSGFFVYNNEQQQHGEPQVSYVQYLVSPHFWEATSENWESEFLQMGSMVVLTIFLKQKGSAESNKLDEDKKPKSPKEAGARRFMRENGLGFAMFGLFFACFAAHVASGLFDNNAELLSHGAPPQSLMEFLMSPDLWFQSMQNWQSEFLAVASLTILSIWLRQEGSAESKELSQSNEDTGG